MRQRIPKTLQGKNFRRAVKQCVVCGEDFEVPAYMADQYSACSKECTSANRRLPACEKKCAECGASFVSKSKGAAGRAAQFCSNPCRIAALQRVPRPFKGKGEGWFDDEGHVVLAVWDGDERRVVKRARLVMESEINRRLARTEVVHHINLSPADDRPENLWLCRDQVEHMRIHAFTERLMKTGLLNLCGDAMASSEDEVG